MIHKNSYTTIIAANTRIHDTRNINTRVKLSTLCKSQKLQTVLEDQYEYIRIRLYCHSRHIGPETSKIENSNLIPFYLQTGHIGETSNHNDNTDFNILIYS